MLSVLGLVLLWWHCGRSNLERTGCMWSTTPPQCSPLMELKQDRMWRGAADWRAPHDPLSLLSFRTQELLHPQWVGPSSSITNWEMYYGAREMAQQLRAFAVLPLVLCSIPFNSFQFNHLQWDLAPSSGLQVYMQTEHCIHNCKRRAHLLVPEIITQKLY